MGKILKDEILEVARAAMKTLGVDGPISVIIESKGTVMRFGDKEAVSDLGTFLAKLSEALTEECDK